MTGLRFARGNTTPESGQTSVKRGGLFRTAAKRLSSTAFTWYQALDEIRSYHYLDAYRTLGIPMGDRLKAKLPGGRQPPPQSR